ncbi:MAG TPA: hypothetical protein VF008_23535, partial [Niastella sp.]
MKLINQVSLFFILIFFPCALFAADIQIINLQVEYTTTPIGIDIQNPRFSWQMEAAEGGCSQTAYQIIVTDELKQVLWNSGRNNSDVSLHIKYAGTRLKPGTRYLWKLIVWDQQEKKHTAASWFETGLMNPDPKLSAWSGAQWIGGGDKDMVLHAAYLPVFKLNVELQLDEASRTTRAGFIYGANDNRLMDKHKNLYKLENKKDSSWILIELDIAALALKGAAELHIYRVGYDRNDKKDLPLKTFSIPTAIINDKNKYGKHAVSLCSVLGDTHIYINGQAKENLIGNINLNPLGKGGDFIAFPVVAEIGFSVLKGQVAYFSNVEIRNYRSPGNILFSEDVHENYHGIFAGMQGRISIVDSSYKVSAINSDAFVIADPTKNSMPMLRTTFSPSTSPISKARLYVTARGIY